ncbi:oleate hydratase [Streptomyces sp. NPDC058646]|uniref:oleate hydratase n=1 Tax=Streptomyces sp. NPDC058646 TaxID=3346574 RepID=UPI0036603C54
MYYSSGNYEAFARPRKPEGVERKTAWFVGAGLASLAGAAFLVRDGQMSGDRITVLERLKLPGGALDGIKEPRKGFVIRGGHQVLGARSVVSRPRPRSGSTGRRPRAE